MMYNNNMHYVTTHDPQRLAHWERLLGSDRLPVRFPRPRLQVTRRGELLAYDLDTARLGALRTARLAASLARATNRPYREVSEELTLRGWPIPAEGVVLVQETAVPTRKRPFAFLDRFARRFQPAAH